MWLLRTLRAPARSFMMKRSSTPAAPRISICQWTPLHPPSRKVSLPCKQTVQNCSLNCLSPVASRPCKKTCKKTCLVQALASLTRRRGAGTLAHGSPIQFRNCGRCEACPAPSAKPPRTSRGGGRLAAFSSGCGCRGLRSCQWSLGPLAVLAVVAVVAWPPWGLQHRGTSP